MVYQLKENDPVLGEKGRIIANDVYNLLPKETQQKYELAYGKRLKSYGVPETTGNITFNNTWTNAPIVIQEEEMDIDLEMPDFDFEEDED